MLNNELKHNPFCVPENYFESLQEQVLRKSSVLSTDLKKHPFSVPENYFESLHGRIAEKVAGTAPQTVPPFAERRSWRSQLLFAASFAFLVVMGYGMFSLLSKPEQTIQHVEEDLYALLKTVSPNMSNVSIMDAVLGSTPTTKTEVVKNDDIITYLADGNLSIYDIAATLD